MVAQRQVIFLEYVQLQMSLDDKIIEHSMEHIDLLKGLHRIAPRLLKVMRHGDGIVKVIVEGGRVKACPMQLEDRGD